MNYRPEVIEYLSSPITWVIAEILAFVLFIYCLAVIIKQNKNRNRVYRTFELFGFVVFAGIFENIGVIGNTYNYSLDRLVMIGVVPLSILMFEAVIFYAALRFAELMKFPKWAIPFVVGFLGVLQDLTIDPVAVFDLHLVKGVMEGRWNWTSHYKEMFFGIPYFNYTGWFFLMFYYATLILLGRYLYKKSKEKTSVGIAYITIAPIAGVLLIVSPINRFLLFLYPIFPLFKNRVAEISMLSLIMIVSMVIMFIYRKRGEMVNIIKQPVVWVIPLILHLFDIILAFSLKITLAYIPVILFASVHLGYLAYYLLKSKIKGETKDV
ncbi:MAG: carotenoid biosynthesis protein [Clostridiales bacterium]|nr:carotenoid biosynthesis protein [Clostridiales bacterium]